ncbi:MAG: hypothetical protein ACXVA9_08360 [Bdellovibrionales bacterium]
MGNTILKSTLIMAAILLSGTKVHAQTPAKFEVGTRIEMLTNKVDKDIVGKATDGNFYSISCTSHIAGVQAWPFKVFTSYSADLFVPTTYGDLVPADSDSAREKSSYMPLTAESAQAVCTNPSGNYVLNVVERNSERLLAVADFQAIVRDPKADRLSPGDVVQVRTRQVGEKIVAVTGDGKFFAILCSMGLLSKTADFIYPNYYGNIAIDEYNAVGTRVSSSPAKRQASWSMDAKAMGKVCNYPNGTYTLRVAATDNKDVEVHFESTQSVEANAHQNGNGF